MYSRSHSAGAAVRVQELRARTCGERPQTWKVEPRAIGYQDANHYFGELRAIAADRPASRRYRADLSRLVRDRIGPRPCVLQVWERAVTVTREGVDASALRTPRWMPLREWHVDHPDSVRVLTR